MHLFDAGPTHMLFFLFRTKEEAIHHLELVLKGNSGKLHLPNSILQLTVSGTVYQEIYARLHPNDYTTISDSLLRRFLTESKSSYLTTTGPRDSVMAVA